MGGAPRTACGVRFGTTTEKVKVFVPSLRRARLSLVFLLLFLPIASRTKQQRNRHKGHCTRLREALSLVQATIAETKLNPSFPEKREREGSDHYTRSCEEVSTRMVYPAGRRTDSSTSPRDTQWTSRRMGFVEHRIETAMNRCRHATEAGILHDPTRGRISSL
jgi:hypothetical protein